MTINHLKHIRSYKKQAEQLVESGGANCCLIVCENCIVRNSNMEFFKDKNRREAGFKGIPNSPCADHGYVVTLCSRYLAELKYKEFMRILNGKG